MCFPLRVQHALEVRTRLCPSLFQTQILVAKGPSGPHQRSSDLLRYLPLLHQVCTGSSAGGPCSREV
jgi:hypothetical protein